jgi:predicted ATPase
MITHVQAKSGFAAALANLKGQRFDFLPGPRVTVLFGPNGCGKTTILKLAAAYTGIDTSNRSYGGGWNRAPRFFSWDDDKVKFPDVFKDNAIGKCEADVGWEGSSCFYNSAGLSESGGNLSTFVSSASDSPDGMMDFEEQVALTVGHCSEGEFRNHKIFKVVEAIKSPPALSDRDGDKKYVKYVKSLPRTGPLTLLWDEPDRSLSVDAQLTFWGRFILGLAKQEKIQIVVASHSMVLLHMPHFLDSFKIIDVEKGYLEKCQKQLQELTGIIDVLRADHEKKKEPKPEPAKTRKKSKK